MLVIHPLAPMGLLMAAPLLALVMLLRLHGTPPQPAAERKSASLRLDCLPYLLCALLLAAAVSMMQLGLSPALTRQFATDTAAISHRWRGCWGWPQLLRLSHSSGCSARSA